MQATLIHNAGGGSANLEAVERAVALLSPAFSLEVCAVGEGQNPATLAKEAAARGSQLLIAAGGDGTVSAVAGVVVERPELCLAILPQGTANSIAGSLGIPGDVEGACAAILDGTERTIDTALANGRPMVLMATIGLHAEAVTQADPEKKRRYGALAYVLEASSRLLEESLFEVTLESEGVSSCFATSALTVANVAPPTTLFAQGPASVVGDDGLLDVTLVAIDGVAEAIATSFHLATRALAGMPASRPNVAHFRCRALSVTTPEPRRVMIDGEDACETPLRVEARPASLRVKVPKGE